MFDLESRSTLRTDIVYIELFSYLYEIRRPQNLSVAHNVLAQESQKVHSHETKSCTRESIPARRARPAVGIKRGYMPA